MSAAPQPSIAKPAYAAAAESNSALRPATELFGRILLSVLFLASGLGKISAYAATAGYMSSVGVPGGLLPLVIVAEVGGAIAIIAGWQTRIISVLLAVFTLLTALVFHNNVGDQIQMVMFLKNLAITGAFLTLAANGAGRYSLDARKAR
jgi:putative oxidoreductase